MFLFSKDLIIVILILQLDVLSPSSRNTLTTLERIEEDATNVLTNKKAEKQMNEDVRNMMANLFTCLEEELMGLIDYIKEQDDLYV